MYLTQIITHVLFNEESVRFSLTVIFIPITQQTASSQSDSEHARTIMHSNNNVYAQKC